MIEHSHASARGNIDRSLFATPAGQRGVSERAPDARLPSAQAVASLATCDGMRSWLTAQVPILFIAPLLPGEKP